MEFAIKKKSSLFCSQKKKKKSLKVHTEPSVLKSFISGTKQRVGRRQASEEGAQQEPTSLLDGVQPRQIHATSSAKVKPTHTTVW